MTAIPSTGKDVVTEVGEWLGGEFASRLSPDAVHREVRAAARDLDGSIVPEALGDMVHRLARGRLTRLSAAGPSPPAATRRQASAPPALLGG